MKAASEPPTQPGTVFGTGLIFIGCGLMVYAAILLFAQGFTWLRSGLWQPLPMYSLFITEGGQRSAVALPGIDVKQNLALTLAPPLGSFNSVESFARSFTGNAEGAYMIAVDLLGRSLGGWSFVIACLAFYCGIKLLDLE